MDTRIALSGANPDVYGALMRGWQGAEMRIQDVNAQQDRAALMGALGSRYADQPTTGVLARLAPEVLQNEQRQIEYQAEQQKYGQEQRLQALPAIAGISEQLLQIESPEERAAAIAGYMPQLEQTLGPEGAKFLAQSFADTSNEALTRNVQLAKMQDPTKATAKQKEFDALLAAAGIDPGSPEAAEAARIALGTEARKEPAPTTDQPIGQPRVNEFGEWVQAVQKPNGDMGEVKLGSKQFTPTPANVTDSIQAASDAWEKSMTAAARADDLAARFMEENPPGGMGGAASEAVKGWFGTEDGISSIRRQWISFKNDRVLEQLPPGTASETDVQRIEAGLPKDFTNATQVSEFLTSMANVSRALASYNEFKAQYLSENKSPRGMLEAWQEVRPKRAEEKTTEAEPPKAFLRGRVITLNKDRTAWIFEDDGSPAK